MNSRMNRQTLLGATRSKCSQTGENLLFLANSMMNNERDVSIDTTENAMLKLLRSQTSGILNIPQGCDYGKPNCNLLTKFDYPELTL